MDEKRFEVIYKQDSGFGAYFRILRDRETGVEYLFMGEDYGAGLTPLLDASGRPFFVGVQYHPEFKSRPNRPHPLFTGFISAALEK